MSILSIPQRPYTEIDFTRMVFDSRVVFTRASTGTYFDAAGVMQTAAVDEPRIDHDPFTGEVLGLLVEDARTNLLLNSAALSTQAVTVAATAYTLSFYGTGTITLSGSYSATVNGVGSFPSRTTLTFTPTAGSLNLTVSGTVQYAQLEAFSFASSYIPTTTSAATRSADIARISTANLGFNFTNSTLLSEYKVGWQNAGTTRYLHAVDGNGRMIYFLATTTSSRIYDGTTIAASPAFTYTNFAKTASSFGSSGLAIATNGSAVSTASFDGTFGSPGAAIMGIGGASNGTANKICGWIRKMRCYDRQIVGNDLKALTA